MILLTLKEELISFEIKCVTEALIPQSVKIKMNWTIISNALYVPRKAKP